MYAYHKYQYQSRCMPKNICRGVVVVQFYNKQHQLYKTVPLWLRDGFATTHAADKAAKKAMQIYRDLELSGYPDSALSTEKRQWKLETILQAGEYAEA